MESLNIDTDGNMLVIDAEDNFNLDMQEAQDVNKLFKQLGIKA